MSEANLDRTEYQLSLESEAMDVAAVHAYLSRSYWAEGISLELVPRAIRGSLCFGLFHSRCQVAFARVADLLGSIDGLSRAEAGPLIAHWCASWKRLAPRSKPELAVEIAPFIAALHGAATYAHFLQQIEESEWPYHSGDVPRCLGAAQTLLRA